MWLWPYCTSHGLPLLLSPVETVSRISVPSGRTVSAGWLCPTTNPALPRHWLLSVAGLSVKPAAQFGDGRCLLHTEEVGDLRRTGATSRQGRPSRAC
jgi:hypothetical protein